MTASQLASFKGVHLVPAEVIIATGSSRDRNSSVPERILCAGAESRC
jgi:hypothetical protein